MRLGHAPAKCVVCLANRDAVQPRRELRVGPKLVEAAQCRHERLLRDISGVVCVTDDSARERVDAVLMTAHQVGECRRVTGDGARDESMIGFDGIHPGKPTSNMGTLAIWHGYLLGATGSNIYTVNLVREWVRDGHLVVLLCQEPHPESHPELIHEHVLVGRAGRVDRRELVRGGVRGRVDAGLGACIMVQADLEGLLPVYVFDRYEGVEAARFVDLDDAAIARYMSQVREAMQWAISEFPAIEGVVINHAVPGPEALRETLHEAGIPYAVKVHGSELEYAMAHDARFVELARLGLQGAARVLVGSEHIDQRTRELVGDGALGGSDRTVVVPPGVDLQRFRPTDNRALTKQRLVEQLRACEQQQPNGRGHVQQTELRAALEASVAGDSLRMRLEAIAAGDQERHVDRGASARVASLDVERVRLVTYVGKFIEQKGVHLLIAAWPIVREVAADGARLHLLMAGFGPWRERLEAMVIAAGSGNRRAWSELIADDEALTAFMRQLDVDGRLDQWWSSACGMHEQTSWLGLVDHDVLCEMWPLCEVSVVPSVLAEAFGMVAAEAAACGALPMVADHSGLADVASALEARYAGLVGDDQARGYVAYDSSDGARAVVHLAHGLAGLLNPPIESRRALSGAARACVEQEWGWRAIAERVRNLMCDQPAEVSP